MIYSKYVFIKLPLQFSSCRCFRISVWIIATKRISFAKKSAFKYVSHCKRKCGMRDLQKRNRNKINFPPLLAVMNEPKTYNTFGKKCNMKHTANVKWNCIQSNEKIWEKANNVIYYAHILSTTMPIILNLLKFHVFFLGSSPLAKLLQVIWKDDWKIDTNKSRARCSAKVHKNSQWLRIVSQPSHIIHIRSITP